MHAEYLKRFAAALILTIASFPAFSQAMYFRSAQIPDTATTASVATPSHQALPDSTLMAQAAAPVFPVITDFANVNDYMAATDSAQYDTLVSTAPLPRTAFMPMVFRSYEYPDTASVFRPDYSGKSWMRWLEDAAAQQRRVTRLEQSVLRRNPEVIAYNIRLLPEAPKRYIAVANPEEHTIVIHELASNENLATTLTPEEVKKKHWIRNFDASLQFSQAYISPNWYQGGNNNLNALANVYYNVKLNPAYHPRILFETTMQYKLGINNAPNDTVHSYNISDDLLQISSTFGIKAAKKWYYSLTGLFKTQLLNSYASNSVERRAAFMSPGELNIGLGMTYNYVNPKKTVTFDASIAPLTYNLKTCLDRRVDPTTYDIEEGRKTRSKIGSSAELKFLWKIHYNITYRSRLFAFTDYSNAYADWENTVIFEITRFLTTQVFAHLRYDSATPACADENWHKLQVKEILSIGVSYKFSSI